MKQLITALYLLAAVSVCSISAAASSPVTIDDIARLQIPDGFTLTYKVVVKDVRTPAMIDFQVEGIAKSWQAQVKNGGMTQEDVDDIIKGERLNVPLDRSREMRVTLSGKDGKLFYQCRQTAGKTTSYSSDGKQHRSPYREDVFLNDGKKTYRLTKGTGALIISPGFGNSHLLDCYLPGVGLPGYPIAKAADKHEASVTADGMPCKMPDFSYGSDPAHNYQPALLTAAWTKDGPRPLKVIRGDLAQPRESITYERYRRYHGIWLASRMHKTWYGSFIPDKSDAKQVASGPLEETDVTVLGVSDKPLPDDRFDIRTYLAADMPVQDYDTSGPINYRYDPDGGSIEAQRDACLARKAAAVEMWKQIEADEKVTGSNHGDGRDGIALLEAAKTKAKAEGKNVLMIFHASWCGPCRVLHHFMNRPEIKPIIDRSYVVVEEDVFEENNKGWENPGARDLFKRYQCGPGIPDFVILKPSGKKIGGRNGSNAQPPYTDRHARETFLRLIRKTAPVIKDADVATMAGVLKQYGIYN